MPANAVVFRADYGPNSDVKAWQYVEDTSFNLHNNVSGWDAVKTYLDSVGDGTIPMLVLMGHGANGGVSTKRDSGQVDYNTLLNQADKGQPCLV